MTHDRNPQCSTCGSEFQIVRKFKQRENETLFLGKCGQCHILSLEPQPSDAWLAEEYRGYYEKRKTVFNRPKKAFFEELLRKNAGDLNGKEILELGSGEGDCVAAMNSLWPDAQITAVESNTESLPHFSGLRCQLLNQSVEEWLRSNSTKRLDVILLFDLLEHLRNPLTVVSQLKSLHLKPGGVILATFPNSDSLSRRCMGPLWIQYKVEHLHYFSKNSVAALARNAGLETTKLAPLKKRLPIEYFFAVGTQFGPKPLQILISWISALTPGWIKRRSIPLQLGEWLWIASANEH
jgi:2-polyprenyl-3-methyl-5-hydroxy-6-metoxy-1,4-benzoquinol methylase